MVNLDSPQEIKALDPKNLSGSIEQLDKQCEQVFEEIEQLDIDPNFGKADNIVVMGMGGSALGTQVVQSLYFDQLKIPVETVNSYLLPGDVGRDTLVILSSYSGTTEEVLTAYKEAKLREAKLIAISSGGDLGKLVEGGELKGYIFEPKFNPSGQPRMGLGYSILSQLAILAKLGFVEFGKYHLEKILPLINKINSASKIEVGTKSNKAKQIAQKLFCKIPLLFASEHMVGSIHIFANQINENAKTLSAYYTLPEANHHLIEGLLSPKEARDLVTFFFLNSDLYSPRVAKRYPITKELAKKAGFDAVEFKLESKSKIEQAFEFLTLGSWTSFYLAMLYNRDPAPIPNVDFLKEEMAKE